MMEFLAMGGYAGFVWPAYGAAAVILVGFTLNAVWRYRSAARQLDALQARRPGATR